MTHQKKKGRPKKNHIEKEGHIIEEEVDKPQTCGICREDVPNDCAMLCDGICNEWYHLRCVNLDNDDYISINDMADKIKWFCRECNFKLETFFQGKVLYYKQDREINHLRLTVETLLSTVKGVVNDNVRINDKLDKVMASGFMKETSTSKPIISEEVLPSWSTMNKTHGRGRGRSFAPAATNYDKGQPMKDAFQDYSDATEKPSNVASRLVNSVRRDRDSKKITSEYRDSLHKLSSSNVRSTPSLVAGRPFVSPKKPFKKNVVYGKRSNSVIKSVAVKPIRKKAIFVSRLCPEVVPSSIEELIKSELKLDYIKCSQLKTKFDSYSSFHVEINEADLDKVMCDELWPEGSLITHFRGTLKKDFIINQGPRHSPEPFLFSEDSLHPLDPTTVDREQEMDLNQSFHPSEPRTDLT